MGGFVLVVPMPQIHTKVSGSFALFHMCDTYVNILEEVLQTS
jgi:hypothetical protein